MQIARGFVFVGATPAGVAHGCYFLTSGQTLLDSGRKACSAEIVALSL
jgi:hypothetical protein